MSGIAERHKNRTDNGPAQHGNSSSAPMTVAERSPLDKIIALETILESVNSGLALFDHDFKLMVSNKLFLTLLGYPEEKAVPGAAMEGFIRLSLRQVHIDHQTEESSVADYLNHLKNGIRQEKIRLFDNGRYIRFLWRPTPNGIMASALDITDQKQVEELLKRTNDILEERVTERTEELYAAKEVAERASYSKTQFLANMSHELRTPLNAIIGFSQLMMMTDYKIVSPKKRREYATDVNAAGQHLLDVINDILDVTKIEVNQLTLNEKEISVGPLVQSCLQMLKVSAQQGGITLQTDIDEDLPNLIGDPTRIRQIVSNLLSNAIKFTDFNGTVHTKVSLCANQGLLIRISDNGIGIAEDEIEHVQTQFGQAQSSYSRNHQGTGLGLSLVSLLTQAHGGSFDLQSELGEGTTVSVEFPPHRTASGKTQIAHAV